MNIFKKIFSFISIFVILLSFSVTSYASSVTYSGDSGNFIFAPGSNHSPTDLFTNFKDVMPGDSIEQEIVVKNNASLKKKVKISMRAIGATENSEFLSQLRLRVEKVGSTNMFDSTANATAQLTNWVELGMLYSGGEVKLKVILDVPTSLDNNFQSQLGKLDWEFAVEEFEIEASDPKPPETGDNTNIFPIVIVCAVSAFLIILILAIKRKSKENDVN